MVRQITRPFGRDLMIGQPFDNANDGDPVILYDQYADRWLASQFVLNSTNSFLL